MRRTGRDPAAPRRRALPALALLGALLAAALAAPPARALPDCARGGTWLRVRTPHFVLIGDGDREQAVADARVLDHLAGALDRRGGRLGDSSGTRCVVYALEGPGCFDAFAPRHDGKPVELRGYFAHGTFARMLVFKPGNAGGDFQVVTHEYVHALVHARLAGLPLCLNEGLADFFGTFRESDGEVQYGHQRPPYLRWLRTHELMSMDSLFAVTLAAPDYRAGPRRLTIYAESWALVHYLMSTDERRDQFEELLGLLAAGGSAREALARAFPDEPWDDLPRRLRAYVDSPEFTYHRLPADAAASRDSMTVDALTPAEVLDALGDLALVTRGPESDETAAYFRAALAADSTDAVALVSLGWLAEQHREPDRAEAYYRRALALAPDHAGVNFVAGYAAVSRWSSGVLGAYDTRVFPPVLLTARARLARCLARDPENAEALAAYGRTFLFEQLPSPEGAVALTRALQALPTRTDIAIALMKVLANDGETERACALYEGRVRRDASAVDRREAALHLQWALNRRADALRRQGHVAAADSMSARVKRALGADLRPAVAGPPPGPADPGYAAFQRGERWLGRAELDSARFWLERSIAVTKYPVVRDMARDELNRVDHQQRLHRARALVDAGRDAEARSILTALLGERLTREQHAFAVKLLARAAPATR